jgi:NADPH-dependent ferric siderophore reductase
LVSVWVGGDDLADFQVPAPTAHIKVILPPPGQTTFPELGPDAAVWPEGPARPVVRTYTPRRYDQDAAAVEIQFALHGTGPASKWAERATVGDEVLIAGPGGRFAFDPGIERWWIAGDESALPAIGTLLDALPPTAAAEVHVEVAGTDDQIPLLSAADTTIVWHHRRRPDAWGEELRDAARESDIPDGAQIWAACEATAVRQIRNHFLADRNLMTLSMVTRGYWRLGVADHPDHDYGQDYGQDYG